MRERENTETEGGRENGREVGREGGREIQRHIWLNKSKPQGGVLLRPDSSAHVVISSQSEETGGLLRTQEP